MSDEFFKAAVVGPFARRFASVAGSCAECLDGPPPGARSCAGFGPGCLRPPGAKTTPDPTDLEVRLGFRD